MRYDFVYFDLGNVLVHFDHQIGVDNLANSIHRPSTEIRKAIFDSGLEDRFESGKIDGQGFVEQLSKQLNLPLDASKTLEALSNIFTENRSILPVLQSLRRRGYRLGLLSNTCHAHWEWIERQRYEAVEGWFEQIVLSYEVGAMKPDPLIYQAAQQLCQTAPDRIFFTDDRLENVEGARQVGWRATLFEGAEWLIEEISAWS